MNCFQLILRDLLGLCIIVIYKQQFKINSSCQCKHWKDWRTGVMWSVLQVRGASRLLLDESAKRGAHQTCQYKCPPTDRRMPQDFHKQGNFGSVVPLPAWTVFRLRNFIVNWSSVQLETNRDLFKRWVRERIQTETLFRIIEGNKLWRTLSGPNASGLNTP